MNDINFDPLIERFKNNIYGNCKGHIREHIIKQQLLKHLGILKDAPLDCADVGGGLGQMTQWLAEMGHRVDYCDLSRRMYDSAWRTLSENVKTRCHFLLGPYQEKLNKEYDLVHCQAVLEWLAEPAEGIAKLTKLVKPQGYLVAIFYNKAAIMMRNLIRGNINAAFSDIQGDGIGLTPIHPLDIETVFRQIEDQQFVIEHWFGIRTFTDFQVKDIRTRLRTETLLEAESKLCEQDPYRAFGRYIGLIAKKKSSTEALND